MEDVVQKAELLVVEPLPYHGDGCGSTDHGQEENRAVDAGALELLVQQNRKHQCDRDTEGDFNECVFDRVPQGLPGLGGAEHLLVICKTDPLVAHTEVAGLVKGLYDCFNRRIEVQHDQAQHGRRDKSPAPARFCLLGSRAFLFRIAHVFPPNFLYGSPPRFSAGRTGNADLHLGGLIRRRWLLR